MHNVLPASSIDPTAFRELVGQFATGVCVVSAHAHGDELAGITVNSFVSVSLDPLLIAWSVQNGSSQFDLWTKTDLFAVSILADNHEAVARRYASRGSSALDPNDFSLSKVGLPVINGALGHLECQLWSLYPAGDHTMVFGEVIGIHQSFTGKPLGFFGGGFCQITE